MNPETHSPEFVLVGQIIKPHGVLGAVKVKPLTDDPKRFLSLKTVFLGEEDKAGEQYVIERVQFQNSNLILTFEHINSRDEAEQWRRQYIQIPTSEALPLPEGEHYFYELVGLLVVTNKGDKIGVVKDIVSYPANDVIVVKSDDKEILIPDIPDIVERIDMDAGEIVINPMPGLLD